MKPTLNLSKKIKKIRDGPALGPDDLDQIDSAVLTLRIITSQVYGIYDPLVLLSLVTVKYKLLLQELTMRG